MGRYGLKTVRMTLDKYSVDEALKEVEDFEKRLKPAMRSLIEYLASKGVEVARAQLLFIGDTPAYDTGALSESIRYEVKEDEAFIYAGEGLHNAMGDPDSPSYAMYVEYGNGYTRPDGWWYPSPYGWRKYRGQKYAKANGMQPRPFMANTLHSLEEEAKVDGMRIIAEYIGGERA